MTKEADSTALSCIAPAHLISTRILTEQARRHMTDVELCKQANVSGRAFAEYKKGLIPDSALNVVRLGMAVALRPDELILTNPVDTSELELGFSEPVQKHIREMVDYIRKVVQNLPPDGALQIAIMARDSWKGIYEFGSANGTIPVGTSIQKDGNIKTLVPPPEKVAKRMREGHATSKGHAKQA